MNTKILGKDLMVFVEGQSIALATSHTLEISANTVDTSTKDVSGKWIENEVSTLLWSLSSENLVSMLGTDGHNTISIMDKALAGTKVTVVFGLANPLASDVPTGGFTPNENNVYYTGSAIITSVSINAQNGENATYSISFTGTGALTKVTE